MLLDYILYTIFICWSVIGAIRFMDIIMKYKLSIKGEAILSIISGPVACLIWLLIYCIFIPCKYIDKKITKYLTDNYKKRDD